MSSNTKPVLAACAIRDAKRLKARGRALGALLGRRFNDATNGDVALASEPLRGALLPKSAYAEGDRGAADEHHRKGRRDSCSHASMRIDDREPHDERARRDARTDERLGGAR